MEGTREEAVLLRLRWIEEKLAVIEQAVNPFPQALKIYKGAGGKWGTFQMELTPAHRSKRDLGAVFVSSANPSGAGDKSYDWDNKIVMALNLGDISKLLGFIDRPMKDADGKEMVRLFHDPKAGTSEARQSSKTLSFAVHGDGWFLGMSHKTGEKINQVRLPISHGEMLEMKALLEHACSRILGW